MFPLPAVARQLSKMVEARLHYDGKRKDEVGAVRKRLVDSISSPIYVIVDPKTGQVIRRHDSVATEQQFLEFLLGTR